ncbi:hypothetical protein [Shewanella xiamenensis]|nr:hypothetical protein [Shewanella xiamenensis]BDA59971.1 hypothetical protein NUITMVS1_14340 [Shewanella xiamenensis]BDQ65525.1 hypothetical protein NUITMVS2_13370 [Shewanella xiamenensis]GLD79802.1 hypothetical protein NUITMVS3_42390 [Shewanella xiamenensis]
MYSKELLGVDLGKDKSQEKSKRRSGGKRHNAKLTEQFKEWQANYRQKG